ncbi:unnamed protein product [Schistosoma guineensis]|uniref:Uncharacterized protein n=2 Tax=Schistosoma haematobium TaxID=6185 RepID=A0A922LYJ1_SCHHA|nr:hypothetical protein MS3_00001959 [Schistosoma haematobium]CAH8445693.1 unnamed protein product [Schistosoma bovis]CAH8473249.1 unnamed protein product [Schistosoma intercalatum]CAH8474086.1 unnamed protein product [Schistosoma guineensis]CAH8478466.1 unnamed protein product [Schistosoma curassoni]KAH9596190.1 hypothetical protein MS3_00001959 [Schistosoma haematobium]
MPRPKKPNRLPLEFINVPFSKPKGETVYKTCSEVYPEVKRAPTNDAYFWFEPCFKTVKVEKKRPISRSTSSPRQHLPELQFLLNGPIPINSISSLKKQKSCPLFPLKSPEVLTRKVVVLVEETPESTNRMTRRYSKYNSTVNALSEQLSECTEDMLKLTIKK